MNRETNMAEKMLAALPDQHRQIVKDVMKQHPQLTVQEAIEALNEAGM
jgi:hypothetical protein